MSDDVNPPVPGDDAAGEPAGVDPAADPAAADTGASTGTNRAVVVVIVVVVIALLALLGWLLFGSDDGDDLTSVTVVNGSTIEATAPTTVTLPDASIVDGTIIDVTVPPTTVPPTTVPPTTVPPTTAPATTAPPETTAPPSTTLPEIVPDPDGTVADIIAGSPGVSRLAELLSDTGLDVALAEDGPFTVFGPSNDAFETFESTPEGAAVLADPDQLEQLLLRHVVAESLDSSAVFEESTLETLAGDTLAVDGADSTIEGAVVLVADTEGTNGFLHVVDAVLVAPPAG